MTKTSPGLRFAHIAWVGNDAGALVSKLQLKIINLTSAQSGQLVNAI